MRETNATVLLQRKAARLRLETGNDKLHASRTVSKQQVILRAMTRPFKLLVLSPIVLLVSLYAGIVFGLVFLLFATLPAVFGDVYGFDAGTAGLAYLGVGVGFVLALGVFSALSDRAVTGGDSRPERRLLLMRYAAPVAPLGCFVYGWTAQYGVHWIAPIVGTALVGFGSLFVIVPGQIYLVDAYGANLAASALAANLLIRCPFGAFLDLAAEPLYDKLGLGWGNSVLGFICLAFVPVPWFFYRYGERLRTRLALDV